jgi:hypothetical protein
VLVSIRKGEKVKDVKKRKGARELLSRQTGEISSAEPCRVGVYHKACQLGQIWAL